MLILDSSRVTRRSTWRFAARAASSRGQTIWAAPLAWLLGMLLVLAANDACAAALGSLATSVGLFAALAALFVVKGFPAQLPVSALPTAGGALLVAGGAAWWWRARAAGAWRASLVAKSRRVVVGPPVVERRVDLPSGLDREALLAELRVHFLQTQEAWDRGAMSLLQTLTTEEMLHELRLGLPACVEGGARPTEIVTLRADLFGFEELPGALLATVEFSGLMRESAGECAQPFRELWMLTQSKNGPSKWRLARHQALL